MHSIWLVMQTVTKGISCTELEVYNDHLLATKWHCSALMNISFDPS